MVMVRLDAMDAVDEDPRLHDGDQSGLLADVDIPAADLPPSPVLRRGPSARPRVVRAGSRPNTRCPRPLPFELRMCAIPIIDTFYPHPPPRPRTMMPFVPSPRFCPVSNFSLDDSPTSISASAAAVVHATAEPLWTHRGGAPLIERDRLIEFRIGRHDGAVSRQQRWRLALCIARWPPSLIVSIGLVGF